MLKSLRWTLQLWHALLLALVLSVFGGMLYVSWRSALTRSVDAELANQAQELTVRLRPAGPRPPLGLFTQRSFWEELIHHLEFAFGYRPSAPGAGSRAFPERDQPAPGRRPLEQWTIPSWEWAGLKNAGGGLYFAIWDEQGRLLQNSDAAQKIPAPAATGWRPPGQAQWRTRGDLREAIVPGPGGTLVLAGRSLQHEQAELRSLAMVLGLGGAGVMVLGLAGGWFLSARLMRPIQAITATAQNISASNLSGRINLEQTQSELSELARVLNAMFARLEAAFARQAQFTADASHELRTPLSVIYAQAQLALMEERTPAQYRQSLETCLRSAQRMTGLVESLLILARADAGKLEMLHENLDLGLLVNDCVELVAPLAQSRRVLLVLEVHPAQVQGDSNRLSQAVTNVLTNAILYNRQGGQVHITMESQKSQVHLAVADTGVGLATEDQARIFERFYRGDQARSRESGGCGLGLAICKTIVEAHGGTVAAYRRPTEGSVFVLSFPMARESPA